MSNLFKVINFKPTTISTNKSSFSQEISSRESQRGKNNSLMTSNLIPRSNLYEANYSNVLLNKKE